MDFEGDCDDDGLLDMNEDGIVEGLVDGTFDIDLEGECDGDCDGCTERLGTDVTFSTSSFLSRLRL